MNQLACSKRSDSGERCEVKKAMKSRGGLGREVREPLSPLLLPRFYFSGLLFTSHRSPLSERLEQAMNQCSCITFKSTLKKLNWGLRIVRNIVHMLLGKISVLFLFQSLVFKQNLEKQN